MSAGVAVLNRGQFLSQLHDNDVVLGKTKMSRADRISALSLRRLKCTNFKDQDDYNHVSDEQYRKFRRQAEQEFNRRKELLNQSQQAYKSGDKLQAHQLSEQAKQHLEKANNFNQQAADFVFRANNTDSNDHEIDLHGLYVAEAETILVKRIENDIRTNARELHVIVGKGIHSQGGVAKLKPAVEKLCAESNLNCHLDPKNAGVLIIKYSGADNISHQPQQHNQPQYHQQPQHNNNNNNNNNGAGNPIINLVLQLFCLCIKNSK